MLDWYRSKRWTSVVEFHAIKERERVEKEGRSRSLVCADPRPFLLVPRLRNQGFGIVFPKIHRIASLSCYWLFSVFINNVAGIRNFMIWEDLPTFYSVTALTQIRESPGSSNVARFLWEDVICRPGCPGRFVITIITFLLLIILLTLLLNLLLIILLIRRWRIRARMLRNIEGEGSERAEVL